MAKRKDVSVEGEVKRIEARLRDTESTHKFMMDVYLNWLADAEKLRRLAVTFIRAPRAFRPTDRRMMRSFLKAIQGLEEFVKTLQPFTIPAAKMKRLAAMEKRREAKGKK